ncbi:MAG TPA: DUF167 family protein [Gemmatimonadaceae bacterium]|jgi:hypothetical protein
MTVREEGGRVRFSVRVQPRASRDEVSGVHGDALKIRLAAPPVDGAANDALVKFLSTLFAVPRRAVRILAGESSRSKLIEIDGVTARAIHDVAGGVEK